MAGDVALLSQAWLDLQREATGALPARPGAGACIEYRVTGGPDGDELGPADEPDFTLLLSHGDFVEVVRGELDQTVGFMQGRVKVTGNIGRMLSVLPVTTSEPWRDAARRVLAATAL